MSVLTKHFQPSCRDRKPSWIIDQLLWEMAMLLLEHDTGKMDSYDRLLAKFGYRVVEKRVDAANAHVDLYIECVSASTSQENQE